MARDKKKRKQYVNPTQGKNSGEVNEFGEYVDGGDETLVDIVEVKEVAQDSFILALENPGGGFEGFLDTIDNYGSTKSGNLAKYYAGISYLNLGRTEDAINYLESYRSNDDITSIMKAGALGDAYAESQSYDKALSL